MSSKGSSATCLPQPEAAHPHDTEKQVEEPQESDYLPDSYEVDLTLDEHPQNMTTARKWLIVLVISLASLCVTCSSSAAAFAEGAMAEEFHVSRIVTILPVSLFVAGLGVGPLVVGPLSEVYGRNIIYQVSFTLLFVFTWPIVFAPDIAVMLVFRFLSGLCGSTFLSVAGGTVSDLFKNESVANPMALYTLSPFIGPVIGPLYSGQSLFTHSFPRLMSQCCARGRPPSFEKLQETRAIGLPWIDRIKTSQSRSSSVVICLSNSSFTIVWFSYSIYVRTALILGILYLTFQAFPIIFERNHGFNMQETGMAFLGICLGMILAMPTQVYFNRFVRATKTPESHLHKAEMGGILIPVGLWILAFASRPSVHWIVPILGSIPFGSGVYLVFTSVFTFLVTAYRPIAASAMASNSAMRSGYAAAFPLFAGFMYNALGTVGATALLAGIMTAMAPLPFIFRRIGARLRQNSRFAAQT